MNGIAIYMEGGSKGNATLRQGMEEFLQPLKEMARNKALPWKLVCCDPRNEAFQRFQAAVNNRDATVHGLLVDAEGPVNQAPPCHLRDRDGWDLSFTCENTVHLMVQTMETWIVADPAALKSYYGNKDFKAKGLPKARDLETVPKAAVESSLRTATEKTQKGRYQKIKHASDLLKRIDVERVKNRCRHCQRLFDKIGQIINAARRKFRSRCLLELSLGNTDFKFHSTSKRNVAASIKPPSTWRAANAAAR